jgi:dethiobiotin synthetase
LNSGFFITGTDTGVGKTVVTAGLLALFRNAGIDAMAFKPVQSGAPKVDGVPVSQDAIFYHKASGITGDLSLCSFYCFEPPLSPHLAARTSGAVIEPLSILSRCRKLLANHRLLLVEGAGGLCVPLTGPCYTMADLAADLALPLLVVARPVLGTINHTVLTIKYALMRGLTVSGFIFNGLDSWPGILEKDNADMIQSITGVPLLGMLPGVAGLDVDAGCPGDLVEVAGQHLRWREIGGIV